MRTFSHFDTQHWQKVRAERQRLGLQNKTEVGAPVQHALLNQLVTDLVTGAQYVVESVRKDWFKGWFLVATLNQQGSHRVCFIENRSCVDPSVLQEIDKFSQDFAIS